MEKHEARFAIPIDAAQGVLLAARKIQSECLKTENGAPAESFSADIAAVAAKVPVWGPEHFVCCPLGKPLLFSVSRWQGRSWFL